MKLPRYFSLLLIAGLMAACGSKATPTPTSTPSLLPPTPTATRTATSTPLPPTFTPTATATATATPLPALKLVYAGIGGLNVYDLNANKVTPLFQKMEKIGQWSLSPDGRSLIYQLQSPLEATSYLFDLETKQVRGAVPYESYAILWHSSGKAILGYNLQISKYELFRLKDGVVVGQADYGAFSPDGTKLAVFYGQELRIYSVQMDADGQVTGINPAYRGHLLQFGETIYPGGIVWSPGGNRLAFDAQKPWGDPINQTYLYAVNVDGSGLVKLADSTALEPGKVTQILSTSATNYGTANYFSWSPDGSKLVFMAYTFLPEKKMIVDPQVYVVSADGQKRVRITGDELFPMGGYPLWTPDGRLLFQSGNRLVISNPDGSSWKILSDEINIYHYFFFLNPQAEGYLADILSEPFVFNCATGWTRLEVGGYASVAPGDPNRVRTEPKKGDNLIIAIPAGTVVKVLEGPVCADGMVFWKVESESIPGGSGWTAEGDGTEYWLEPYQP